jgi:hypothetical protein
VITPGSTRYPFDRMDHYLHGTTSIPGYWEVREKAGAFSSENIELESGNSGYVAFLHEVGLQSHLAITAVAGAKYHLNSLREGALASVPLELAVWEELPAGFNSLYKAWNGLYSFCFALLYPENLIKTGHVQPERGFRGVGPRSELPSGVKVKSWLRGNHGEIHKLFELVRLAHVYRHVDVHSRRIALRFLIDPARQLCQVLVPIDPYTRPSSVVPDDHGEWVNAIALLRNAIEDHESGFEKIYQYLLNGAAPENFLLRYGLQVIPKGR